MRASQFGWSISRCRHCSSLDASLGKWSAPSKRTYVFSSRAAAKRLLSFKDVPQSLERTNTITDDLQDGKHRNGQDRARHAPRPEPEHQRQNDKHGFNVKRRATSMGVSISPSARCKPK